MHHLPGGSGPKEACIHSLTSPNPEKFWGDETQSAFCMTALPSAKLWEGRNWWSLYKAEMLVDTPWLKGISNRRLAQNLKIAPNECNWKSFWYNWLQNLQGSHENSLRGASGKQCWEKLKETGAKPIKIISLHHRNIIQSVLWKKFTLSRRQVNIKLCSRTTLL